MPAIRTLYGRARIRAAGSNQRAYLFDRYFGPFGSLGEAVRVTGLVNFGTEPELIFLGNHITLADGVVLMTHDGAAGHHFAGELEPGTGWGEIRINDDVFVGVNAIIMRSVTIGKGSVVAAGAVVVKDVAPGTVVGGNPARMICTLAEFRERLVARGPRSKLASDASRKRLENDPSMARYRRKG